MARDEQQAMTAERLAEMTRQHDAAIDALWRTALTANEVTSKTARSLWADLLAEVERRIAREAALVAFVERVAQSQTVRLNYPMSQTTIVNAWYAQARALLASTAAAEAEAEEPHEQAAQGEE